MKPRDWTIRPIPASWARIWQSISKEAWEEWKQVQTRLVNENRLNLADSRARKYLQQQMERFLFEDGSVEAQGYVPPSA